MLLIYGNPDAIGGMPETEQQAIHDEVDRVLAELRASGELVAGHGLAPPRTGRIVRARDGVVAVTDGPFAEAKEQFGGYVMVDVESEERAVEIAGGWPGLEHSTLEVRAVVGSADA
jgi:hypothetical protein